jgi:hypothetical protein
LTFGRYVPILTQTGTASRQASRPAGHQFHQTKETETMKTETKNRLLSDYALAEMREWLCDIFPAEDEEEIQEASETRIIRTIEREYAGGLAEFLRTIDV